MWQIDTVTLQTPTRTNTNGSISTTWVTGTEVLCDVQSISRDYVYKNYGYEEYTEYMKVFDLTNASWVKGNQVLYETEQWLVRNVKATNDKIGLSNHTYVIMSKVIE